MQAFFGYLLYFIPKNLLSFFVGKFVAIKLPAPLGYWSVQWFASRYNLNMDEAEHSLATYETIAQLFTRRLKPGIRPIGQGFVHPVDGQLTRIAPILGGELIQAKGKTYSIKEFLDNDPRIKNLEGGHCLTYYLCPTDYHRVHAPVSAKITDCKHIPGRLWPVNPWSVENITQLFSVNERLIIWLQTEHGPIAYVMVGATNVGKMSLTFDSELVTNNSHWRQKVHKEYSPPVTVEKGYELGVFNMGSTVIILTPKNYFSSVPKGAGKFIKLGQSL